MVIAFVLLALAASAMAAPQQLRPVIPIVSQNVQHNPDGSYVSSYTSGDGASVSTQGFLKATNDKTDVVVAQQGSIAYTSPEGVPVRINYLADEYGTHILAQEPPVAPPQTF